MFEDYTISELPEEKPEEKNNDDFTNLTPEECFQEMRNILSKREKPKQEEVENET